MSMASPPPSSSSTAPRSWALADQGRSSSQSQEGGRYSQQVFAAFPYPPFTPKIATSSSSSTPKITPYVTPYAPQNPLYLGATPPNLVFGASLGSHPSPSAYRVPESGSHQPRVSQPYPGLHPPSSPHPGPLRGGPASGWTIAGTSPQWYPRPTPHPARAGCTRGT